jgi:hypothetical protein
MLTCNITSTCSLNHSGTIRRMLEHYRAWFYRVVICTQDEAQLAEYERVMPLYFPRSPAEVRRVAPLLPDEKGAHSTPHSDRPLPSMPTPLHT